MLSSVLSVADLVVEIHVRVVVDPVLRLTHHMYIYRLILCLCLIYCETFINSGEDFIRFNITKLWSNILKIFLFCIKSFS